MLRLYPNLYTRTCKTIPNENISINLSWISKQPSLNNDDRNLLDNFPPYEECRDAINKMKREKSMFWDLIGPFFYKALKKIF